MTNIKAVRNSVHLLENALGGIAKKSLRALGGLAAASGKLVRPLRVVNNPDAAPAPKKNALRVMSYNVQLGGQNYLAIKRNIAGAKPDLVGLQEASRETATRLAKELGLHVAYYDRPGVAGKAILSRFPIESVRHVGDSVSAAERLGAWIGQAKKGNLPGGEVLEPRGILVASLRIRGKPVDFIDTHLSLGESRFNARQLEALDRFARDRRAAGHEVVVTGDFNTNFNLRAEGPGTPGSDFKDPTDSASEYRRRYGKSPGNAGDAAGAKALRALQQGLHPFWGAGDHFVIDTQGKKMTPEQARAQLASTPKGSKRWRELVDVADGNSHRTADKRFDNILSSFEVRKAWIDFSAEGSDHQPVFAELALK